MAGFLPPKQSGSGGGFLPPKTATPQGGNPLFDFMDAIGQAGASAAGTVAKGAGNVANFAGQAGSYLDPIANAGRLAKTVTGSEGVFQGYKSPLETIGGTIQSGANSLSNLAEDASVKMSEGKQNAGAQWAGGALGNLANTAAGATIGGGAAKSLLSKLLGGKALTVAGSAGSKAMPIANFLADSLGSTQGITAVNEGRLSSPGELLTGAAIDTATLGGSKLMEKLAKFGLSKVPQFSPKVKAELGNKGLQRVGDLMYDNVESIPALKSMNRESIGQSLTPLKAKTYAIVSDKIDQAMKAGAGGSTIDDLMDNVKKAVISDSGAAKAGLSLDEIPKAVKELDTMKAFYKDLLGDAPLDLGQVQQLKKNLRYKTGPGIDSIMSAKNQFKEGVRKNTQVFIEDQVGNTLGAEAKKALKNANFDYNVLNKLTKTLKNKPAHSGYLTDVVSGAAGAASALASLNVGEAVKQAAIAVGAKRLATSAAPKVIFAKLVKKAPEKFLSNFLKSLALKKE